MNLLAGLCLLAVHFAAQRIELDQVGYCYPPENLWRKLTCSVPRREFAIQNVSLSIVPENVLVVTGSSSSGKSTLLKLILREIAPSSGRIGFFPSHPTCIYLDQTPDYESRQCVREILNVETSRQHELVSKLLDDHVLDEIPASLSVSNLYRVELVRQCIVTMNPNTDNQPAPILCLDEWLDKQPSEIVRAIQETLETLVAFGSIVIVVTHVPSRWDLTRMLHLTLEYGKMVSLRRPCDL